MNETAARIAVAAATYWVDRPFSYRVLASLRERVVPGVRVVVPFGSGNRRTEGIVLSVGYPDREDVVLKPVSSVLDSEPVLSDEMLRLALWIRERYFCTVYDAVRAMLPAGLWYRMETVYVLCEGADREKAYGAAEDDERERTVVEALFAHGGTVPRRISTGCSAAPIRPARSALWFARGSSGRTARRSGASAIKRCG